MGYLIVIFKFFFFFRPTYILFFISDEGMSRGLTITIVWRNSKSLCIVTMELSSLKKIPTQKDLNENLFSLIRNQILFFFRIP